MFSRHLQLTDVCANGQYSSGFAHSSMHFSTLQVSADLIHQSIKKWTAARILPYGCRSHIIVVAKSIMHECVASMQSRPCNKRTWI